MGEKIHNFGLGSFVESRLRGQAHRGKPRKGKKGPEKAPKGQADAVKSLPPPSTSKKRATQSVAARAASLANLAKARAARESA